MAEDKKLYFLFNLADEEQWPKLKLRKYLTESEAEELNAKLKGTTWKWLRL